MRLVLLVGVGGAAGSAARYLLGMLQPRAVGSFPWVTFGINVAGSFLLGFVLRLALSTTALTPEWRALLTVGFCGGFTTFSTYSYETAALLESGHYGKATAYALGSVGVALAATFAGLMAAREYLDR
jgi:fluoride exporter